jgi:hypothetical protein
VLAVEMGEEPGLETEPLGEDLALRLAVEPVSPN